MNQITIAGHLGADPEVRFTSSGQKVTTLRVAARARRGGKDETIWWKVTVWGEQFDKIIPYFKKGSPIIVVGELNKPEIFTDREGRPQVSMNITALNIMFSPFGRPDSPGAPGSGEGASAHAHGAQTEMAHAGHEMPSHGQGKADPAFSEDEIPF
ncbi:MAG: single-stranded DNA-binding protein [Verrucomicrobia bacterium]|nr:single-stranded DNA-binding protein [Verrucomicrobiota bacterium]